jgi:hypothetical protein
MAIEIVGPPEAVELSEQLGVRIPLSEVPPDALVDELNRSPPVSSFCTRVEASEDALLLYPKEDAPRGMGTALTAIESLIEAANLEAVERAKSDKQRARDAARRTLECDLADWWESRG